MRIGLEDNIWLDSARTQLATNTDLLRRIHNIAAMTDKKVMASTKLRQLLNLEKGFGQYGRAKS